MPRLALVAFFLAVALAQDPTFFCPMDPDVRSATPGRCPRCGMKLVPGIPNPIEYPLDVRAVPRNLPAGKPVTLEFRVVDPKTGR
ncbi:MAG TPA: heavy metal-binding domain-containing protein, partial [Candidatus Sulfopaludibacter sp.]|nr:heavy metal-binding domain-containing protein [Candidatus Sulfopaludibacter sp.]